MTDGTNRAIEEIRNLKRKSALQQYCHYELARRVSLTSKVLNISLLLLSAATVLSTTDHVDVLLEASSKPLQRHISAILSISVFLLMLVRLELRLAEIASSFKSGGDAHTRILRKIDMILSTLDSKQSDELEGIGVQLTDEYVNITDSSREIPGRDFLRLKQTYLQRKAKSRALDEDPFLNLSDMSQSVHRNQ